MGGKACRRRKEKSNRSYFTHIAPLASELQAKGLWRRNEGAKTVVRMLSLPRIISARSNDIVPILSGLHHYYART